VFYKIRAHRDLERKVRHFFWNKVHDTYKNVSKTQAISELANHSRERNAILNCDWSICLLLMSYCLMFLYVP